MSNLAPEKKIYVAGHRGMVGSAIVRKLRAEGMCNLVVRTHGELDLCDQQAVNDFFATERPDFVVLAAAKVGGIHANNTYPAEFIYQNLMMECNVVHQAHSAGVEGLLFLGSSCIYPRMAPQPMQERALLSGPLESTNEPYALAKIAGIKLCESYNRQYGTDYRSLMPTNIYGPGDNYHGENSHVIPALIKKFHAAVQEGAEQVNVWGTGMARREFLHVDDLANATYHVMQLPREAYWSKVEAMRSHINVGSGEDVTIKELGELIKKVSGFPGKLVFDTSKPDGTPRKLMDVSLIQSLGWNPSIELEAGLVHAYQDYVDNHT